MYVFYGMVTLLNADDLEWLIRDNPSHPTFTLLFVLPSDANRP